MLYFSILPALDSLPQASAGTLLLAAMHYAQDGQEPVFEDATLAFAWALLKPSIDRDGEVYDEKRLRGEWMTYCRQCKRDGNEAVDFETWRQRTVTRIIQTMKQDILSGPAWKRTRSAFTKAAGNAGRL